MLPRPRWVGRAGSSVRGHWPAVLLLATATLAGATGSAGQAVEAAVEPAVEAVAGSVSPAVESERLYLSGPGVDAPRGWEFRIDSGRRARKWQVIPVPSNWELQGFGRYTHGKQWWQPAETAIYRTQFVAPRRFAGRVVELVFEGVMTDADVVLNGRRVGEVHRGGFTRFAYDVSMMLWFHRPNLLEVRVAEASADASVNRAEREADYWTFGGIYRPVYLEVHPPAAIRYVAVDARHDGRLAVDVETVGPVSAEVRVQVETLEGEPVGELLKTPVSAAGGTRVEGRLDGVTPWSAESPNLYRLRVELAGVDGEVLHRRHVRIGFRTIRLHPGQGLFVNGRRVLLKGVNRHSHWPETGRSVPAAVNRRDVELIRSMNMNAVRTAHSPPDADFLDACDELGLYVLDELPGWHDAYDTEVGSRILWEMVRRDVNHPSIILWANGNEGGWNTALDPLFGELDPQGRPVLHPGARDLGFEASHYSDWAELGRLISERAAGNANTPLPVLLPTEILHALYDGGGGASLADYWRRLSSSKRLGGAFLWSLFDEGVVRTDKAGRIDTSGNRGADGLLGPHREPEGSFHTVRELWSPVRVVGFRFLPEEVEVDLENRFDETDLADCTLRWRWLAFPRFPGPGPEMEVAPGGEQALPPAAPTERVLLRLPRPPSSQAADAVELRAFAPDGRELMIWVLSEELPDSAAEAWRDDAADGLEIRSERHGSLLTLHSAAGRWARFDLDTGELVELGDGERRLAFAGGARRADGRRARLGDVAIESRARSVVVRARLEGALDEATWIFHNDGRLRLDYVVRGDEHDVEYLGVGFDGLEDRVRSFTWLGLGPYRVWRNRLAGGRLGVWQTQWNDSVTGVDWRYPELPGFYAGVRWARLSTDEGTLTIAPDRGLFLGLFRPSFAPGARTAVAEAPEGITVLHQIPAIGTKFHRPEALGPAASRRPPPGPRRGGLWLSFDGGGPRSR